MKRLALPLLLVLVLPLALASSHGAYSEPRSGFSASSTVNVQDTAVYKTGYVSENGSQWTAFTLTGDKERSNWVLGQATADISLEEIRYVAIYSCTWNDAWDCSETWQVRERAQSGVDSLQGDWEALMALYDATNGDNWANNDGWGGDPSTMGSWYGVTTYPDGHEHAGRVRTIKMNGNEANIGWRTDLDVDENQLGQNAGEEGGNNLVGTLPPEIGNLKKLLYLNVKSNQLTGPIPPEIGEMESLEWLALAGQYGEICIEQACWNENNHIGNRDYGSKAWVESNSFSGEIPPELGGLPNILMIEIRRQHLTGTIPPQLGEATTLKGLFLNDQKGDNPLGGELPEELGNLVNLEHLHLDSRSNDATAFTGQVPQHMQDNLKELRHIRLRDNNFTGDVPEFDTHDLRVFTFSHNYFTGPFPIEYFQGGDNPSMSAVLGGSQNSAGFTGGIPDTAQPPRNRENYNTIAKFNFPSTGLTGEIPQWVQTMRGHQVVYLNGNEFTGEFPAGFLNGSVLKTFHIGANQLSGPLPDKPWATERMLTFRIGNNDFTGPLPAAWESLTASSDRMLYFYVQGNQLSGEIPAWVADIKGLNRFYAYNNKFTPKDILPHRDAIQAEVGTYEYLPQKPFGQAETVSVGATIDRSEFAYTGNTYQWLKDGTALSGETSPTIDTTSHGAGEYVLQIVHPDIDFTFTSEPVTLQVNDASTDSVQGDHDALMALYDSTNGDEWDSNDGWGESPETMGSWYGVETDSDGRVVSIKLNGNDGWETYLQEGAPGVVGGNGLTGTLPAGDILGNLKRVKYFNVKNNYISGEIPPGVFGMHSLTHLLLNGGNDDMTVDGAHHPGKPAPKHRSQYRTNTFGGEVPDLFDQLPDLEWFEATGEGSYEIRKGEGYPGTLENLPPSIARSTKLKGLHVGYNNIDSLPKLENLTQLRHLAFGRNRLADHRLPDWIGELTNLKYLWVHYNALRGPIPDLSNLHDLRIFATTYNYFTGEFPDYFLDGSMPNINMLEMGFNDLTGGFPEVTGETNLVALGLDGNELTGPIPESWSQEAPGMINFGFGWNELSGEIPDLSHMGRLRYVRAYDNNFVGTPPMVDTTNTDLQNLYYGSNQMSGPIDPALAEVANLPKFDTFDVSNNEFTESDLQPLRDALAADGNLHVLSDGGQNP